MFLFTFEFIKKGKKKKKVQLLRKRREEGRGGKKFKRFRLFLR